jgi:plasmid stabilization system protein ParE
VIAGTPYIIFYRLKPQQVEILAVMHGARNR